MERMDMTPAHKWEPSEKGRIKGNGGSTGKTIKGIPHGETLLEHLSSYNHRLPRGTKSNLHVQHNTREGSLTPLVQTRHSVRYGGQRRVSGGACPAMRLTKYQKRTLCNHRCAVKIKISTSSLTVLPGVCLSTGLRERQGQLLSG
jgi:hypothetical protein